MKTEVVNVVRGLVRQKEKEVSINVWLCTLVDLLEAIDEQQKEIDALHKAAVKVKR